MLGSLPLLALVVIAYNLIVFLTKLTMESAVFSIALVSGSIWVITVGTCFSPSAWCCSSSNSSTQPGPVRRPSSITLCR